MSRRSVINESFTIDRTYPTSAARVFAAFASEEAKSAWGDTGGLEPADGEAGVAEFDFRPGGRERFGIKVDGRTLRYDARYYDIVTDHRIVYAYEMYCDDVRISVSLTTIEFAEVGDATRLTFTEQGAFLDGFDGTEAPALRRGGTEEMLDNLVGYLATATEPAS
ncbi:MAG TPA: SRPBCC domain-containing protein [Acidimicrobiales bacterium]|nr:SRPBCC domain-containing protein [Acidimicrobiales bacterium]